MAEIISTRMSAVIEGDLVVVLMGMRIHKRSYANGGRLFAPCREC